VRADPPGLRVKQLVLVIGAVYFTLFFVAYQAEGPFRDLLAIALLMAVVIAVVPDDAGQQAHPPGTAGSGDHRQGR
jgi:hypothetical protein